MADFFELFHPKLLDYSEQFTSPEDDFQAEISRFTAEHHPKSHMLSGHVQGKFLEMISHMIRPERILEIGTFTGYSAVCLAKGLTSTGKLHTIDCRDEEKGDGYRRFMSSEEGKKIIFHLGNALEIIPTLDEEWDLVFIDADKVNYVNYFDMVLPKMRKGGFILADNVLFHGEVLNEPVKGKNAVAITAFNNRVKSEPQVEHVLLTIRDGLMLIRKK
ncbi:MAG TPA: O-methyltransferase [Parasegetibacter sp.]